MRATEIIRSILDLIDHIDIEQDAKPSTEVIDQHDDTRRFRQIFDLLSVEKDQTYNNSPAEVVAGIDSVTKHAGGGWNGPKNPADIRADSISMYPNHQHRPE